MHEIVYLPFDTTFQPPANKPTCQLISTQQQLKSIKVIDEKVIDENIFQQRVQLCPDNQPWYFRNLLEIF